MCHFCSSCLFLLWKNMSNIGEWLIHTSITSKWYSKIFYCILYLKLWTIGLPGLVWSAVHWGMGRVSCVARLGSGMIHSPWTVSSTSWLTLSADWEKLVPRLLPSLVHCPSCIDVVHNHTRIWKHVIVMFDHCMVSNLHERHCIKDDSTLLYGYEFWSQANKAQYSQMVHCSQQPNRVPSWNDTSLII